MHGFNQLLEIVESFHPKVKSKMQNAQHVPPHTNSLLNGIAPIEDHKQSAQTCYLMVGGLVGLTPTDTPLLLQLLLLAEDVWGVLSFPLHCPGSCEASICSCILDHHNSNSDSDT